VVVEDIASQEVGCLLDEALREEPEFSVWIGYCGGHAGLDFNQLGIELFPGQRLENLQGIRGGGIQQ
jgi:hypothetical protein